MRCSAGSPKTSDRSVCVGALKLMVEGHRHINPLPVLVIGRMTIERARILAEPWACVQDVIVDRRARGYGGDLRE
jgi:hypothetical protein